MAATFDNAYIAQYDTALNLSFQQMESRLLHTVQVDKMAGSLKYFERLGKAPTFQTQASRLTPIVGQDIQFSRRLVQPVSYRSPILIDNLDKLRMAIDPSGEIVKSQSYSGHRLIDSTIINALYGPANTQSVLNGTISQATFLSGNIVAVGYDEPGTGQSGNTGLTVGKIKAARALLESQEAIMPGERLFCVYNSTVKQQLLRDPQVTNIFYNDVKPLTTGDVGEFLGITFVRSELIPGSSGVASLTGSVVSCFVYPESALKFAWLDPLHGRIDLRPDLGEVYQLLAAGSFSAVRMWEEKVVRIDCDPTV